MTQARKAKGKSKKDAAAAMGLGESTMGSVEWGRSLRAPAATTQRAIETYYGWRLGSIKEIWDKRRELHPSDVTMDLVSPEKPTGLLKASHLTDQELMAELNFRFLMRDNRSHE